MKCLGFRSVRISSIKLPGGMNKLRDLRDVAQMAESYDWTGGQPMEPVILDDSLTLRAGRHRIAAAMNKGLKAINAMVFEGSEEELARLTDIENAYRRHVPEERDAALARLVGAAQGKPEPPPEGSAKPDHSPGRPVTPQGAAIREVAKATGTTPAAVRAAVARVEAKEREEKLPPSPLDVPMENWGLPIPTLVQRSANVAAIGLREIRTMVSQAKRALSQLEEQNGRKYVGIRESLERAQWECSAYVPVAICHACKAIPVPMSECTVCVCQGYVGKTMHEQAKDELAVKGTMAMVFVRGKLVPVEQARRMRG